TSDGGDVMFATTQCGTTVDAVSISDRTSTSGMLHATLTPHGSAIASAYFEYGPTLAYGAQTPVACLGAASACQIDEMIGPLTPSTLYHFRVHGTDGGGPFYDGVGSFWTCAAAGCGAFSDDPVVAGSTVIKAVHLAEPGDRINALRARVGLAA